MHTLDLSYTKVSDACTPFLSKVHTLSLCGVAITDVAHLTGVRAHPRASGQRILHRADATVIEEEQRCT